MVKRNKKKMNKRELIKTRKENWCKYHIPGCSNLHRLKFNSIQISIANSLKHELKKAEICYKIKKQGHFFITEAESNKRNKRVDIVDLDDGMEYECEVNMERAFRFLKEKKVIVIPVGWSFNDKKWKNILLKRKI